MRLERDYEELLKLFNRHKVKYCIVGAFALAYYVRPRYTKDLDITVEASPENGKKIIAALEEFGFGSLDLSPDDFAKEKEVIQLGYEPIRIDLLTSIKGVKFKDLWKNKKTGTYGKQKVFFANIDHLIKNKAALNRAQDKADLAALRSAKKR